MIYVLNKCRQKGQRQCYMDLYWKEEIYSDHDLGNLELPSPPPAPPFFGDISVELQTRDKVMLTEGWG